MKKIMVLILFALFCNKNPMASHEFLNILNPDTVNQVYEYIAEQEKQNGVYYLNIVLDRPGVEVIKYFESRVGIIEDRRPFMFEKKSWRVIFSYHYPTD